MQNMMKFVAIALLLIFTSSCETYRSGTRDVERCHYSIADPNTGTYKDAIDANRENYFVNKPHWDEQFDQLGIDRPTIWERMFPEEQE